MASMIDLSGVVPHIQGSGFRAIAYNLVLFGATGNCNRLKGFSSSANSQLSRRDISACLDSVKHPNSALRFRTYAVDVQSVSWVACTHCGLLQICHPFLRLVYVYIHHSGNMAKCSRG